MRAATQLTRPPLLPPGRRTPRRQPRLPSGLAQTAQTQLPHAARARRGGAASRITSPPRAKPFVTQMPRGQLPASSCRHQQMDGLHRQSGRNAFPSGITPSNIMSPARSQPHGSWTEIRLGARAHHNNRLRCPDRGPPTIEPRIALDRPTAAQIRTFVRTVRALRSQLAEVRRRGPLLRTPPLRRMRSRRNRRRRWPPDA